MTKRYFDDFSVGDTATSSVARTVSESDVYACAGLSGNYGELHTNKHRMEDSEFGGVLVQGVLLLVLMEGFAKRLPWDFETIAMYGFDNVRFVNPVLIDDTLRMEAEVAETTEKGDDRGVVTFTERLHKVNDAEEPLAVTRDRHLLIARA